MNNCKILIKQKYDHNQNNNILLVKEYVILEKDGKRYLALHLDNRTKSILNEFKIEVIEKDFNGNFICLRDFNEKNLSINGRKDFVSKTLIELEDTCEDINLQLKTAIFNDLVFDNGKKNKIIKNKTRKFNKLKKVKKIPLVCSILSLVLFAGVLGDTFAYVESYKSHQNYFNYEDFRFQILDQDDENSPLAITRYYGDSNNVEIPEKINNHIVKKIETNAFQGSNVKSIKFNSNVELDNSCFEDCHELESFDFSHVIEIPSYTFKNCYKLTTLESDNIRSIGYGSFLNCNSLTKIKLDNDVLSLGDAAFAECNNLKTIEINSNIVSRIERETFKNCSNIEEITIRDYSESFNNSRLEYIFNDSINKLKSFKTDHLQFMRDGFFKNYVSLKDVYIEKLDSGTIPNNAFQNCDNLKNVTINSQIKYIGDEAFRNTAIENFNASDVIKIGEYAFSECKNLKEINLTDTLSTIGKGAFKYCISLDNVYLSNNLTKLEQDTFLNCTSLSNLKNREILNTIEVHYSAFTGCNKLN